MRGKGPCLAAGLTAAGITPAYAGKSIRDVTQWLIEQDHPRVCGEKHVAIAGLLPSLGSPPRMRGKVQTANTQEFQDRITPAYAGKSLRKAYEGQLR